MKKIEFREIGDYHVSDEKSSCARVSITVKQELKDALIKLDHFSHCVLFTKDDDGTY